MRLDLVLGATALMAASGLPALLGGRVATRASAVLQVVAAGLGGAGAAGALFAAAPPAALALPWRLAVFEVGFRLDGLAALFLVPIFLVAGLGAIYAEETWPAAARGRGAGRLRFFYGLTAAAMALVVVAADGVALLVAWEAMAIGAYFLVVADDREEAVREAGWIYLAATHAGTLCLFGLFALLRGATGSFELAPLPAGLAGGGFGAAIFLLTVAGFGVKAGIMPLHVWLPGAHSAAPSHVSAVMSGVLIKIGVYGIIRVLFLVPDPPPWWGGALLAIGAVSGVLGVAFALGQHDLKRLLAYHSVENIGIIVLGVGLALVGRAAGEPVWVALGLGGALLHVVNHALFKSLLFFGAGAVAHATGTRDLERLGGLGKTMPRTAALFLVGAVAISGLPPLNGFVSEWLLYLGFFGAVQSESAAGLGAALMAPLLALIGALALACFVKAFGIVFLGSPRAVLTARPHDPGAAMLAPMAVLALLCAAIGLAPQAIVPALERAVAAAVPGAAGAPPALAEIGRVGVLSAVALGFLAALAAFGLWLSARTRGAPRAVTWDCGYHAPSPRMQSSGSSFAATLLGTFRWALRPVEQGHPVRGTFPVRASFHSRVPDTVLDRFLLPVLRRLARLTLYARYLQQGRLQVYLLYVAVTLLVLLALV